MSPPANTPGQPVISELETRTVPSRSNSTPGTARRNVGVGVLAEGQDHRVRRQGLEAAGRLRVAGLVELHLLDLQLGALHRLDRPQPVDPHALSLGVLRPRPRGPASARGCGGRRSTPPRRPSAARRALRPSRCCRLRTRPRDVRSPDARPAATPRRNETRVDDVPGVGGRECRLAWTGARRRPRTRRRRRPRGAPPRGPRPGGC